MKVHFRMLADFSIEVPDDATEAEKEQSLKEVKMNLESIIPNDVGNGNITSTDQDFDLELNGYQVVVVQMPNMSRYCGPDNLAEVGFIPKRLNENDVYVFQPNLWFAEDITANRSTKCACNVHGQLWLKRYLDTGVKWELEDNTNTTEPKNGQ